MERDERNNYYRGEDTDRMGYHRAPNNGYRSDNDYGRYNSYGSSQNDRRWIEENREDFRERGVPLRNNDQFQNYRNRDYDMESNYRDNTRGQQGRLGDIRQGYGVSSFEGSTDRYDSRMNNMRRDREGLYDQGYGSGRLSGYSGSAFGGANYSSRGDFGGSSDYGSMSGGGGNMDRYVSTSGYGGYGNDPHGNSRRDVDYDANNRTRRANWSDRSYRDESSRYGSNNDSGYGRRDRGGYFNDDRNR